MISRVICISAVQQVAAQSSGSRAFLDLQFTKIIFQCLTVGLYYNLWNGSTCIATVNDPMLKVLCSCSYTTAITV